MEKKRNNKVLYVLADDSYLRSDSKAPKLGKSGCRKFTVIYYACVGTLKNFMFRTT